ATRTRMRLAAQKGTREQPVGGDAMPQRWYYRLDGQQRGPISAAELKQLAAAGKLKPTYEVKKEGMADWLPASQVKGLFPDTHDKVRQKADAVGKTAETVSKVAKGAGKVSDA